MRIAFTDFHHGWGGQAYQVLLLAEALRNRGHEVLVIIPHESDLDKRCSSAGIATFTGCQFKRGFRPACLFRDIKALASSFRNFNPDVIHCHGSQDAWQTLAVHTLTRTRAVLIRTKHNSYPVAPHAFNRWLYGSAFCRTIAVAENIREGILSAGIRHPERVVTLHAGLPDGFGKSIPTESEKIRTLREEVRNEFDLPAQAQLIGLVGRLMKEKGQEVLMQAVNLLKDSHPDLHVLLIGTGGQYDQLLATRDGMGLNDRVHFTLFRNDIERLTAALDISVLAATDCDASSTVLKEAMSLNIPVIGTNIGGTREIIDNGNCGRLIPADDAKTMANAIEWTLNPDNAKEKAEQVKRAQERVDQLYRMHSVAQSTEAIYEQALQEKRGPQAKQENAG